MDKKIGFIDKKIDDVGDKLNKLIEADPKVDSSGVVDSWWLAWTPAGWVAVVKAQNLLFGALAMLGLGLAGGYLNFELITLLRQMDKTSPAYPFVYIMRLVVGVLGQMTLWVVLLNLFANLVLVRAPFHQTLSPENIVGGIKKALNAMNPTDVISGYAKNVLDSAQQIAGPLKKVFGISNVVAGPTQAVLDTTVSGALKDLTGVSGRILDPAKSVLDSAQQMSEPLKVFLKQTATPSGTLKWLMSTCSQVTGNSLLLKIFYLLGKPVSIIMMVMQMTLLDVGMKRAWLGGNWGCAGFLLFYCKAVTITWYIDKQNDLKNRDASWSMLKQLFWFQPEAIFKSFWDALSVVKSGLELLYARL